MATSVVQEPPLTSVHQGMRQFPTCKERAGPSAEPIILRAGSMLEAPARAALLAKRAACDHSEEPLTDAFERGLVVEPRAREYGAEHIVCHGA